MTVDQRGMGPIRDGETYSHVELCKRMGFRSEEAFKKRANRDKIPACKVAGIWWFRGEDLRQYMSDKARGNVPHKALKSGE